MKANIKVLGALALFAVLMDCGGGGSSPPPVAVSVAPTAAALKPGDRQGFNATVTGSSNTAVTWTVQEASGFLDAL